MKIQPLSFIGTDELFDAFSNAFSGYERTWNRGEFDRLLKRRGYVPDLSFGAFDGDKLVGFIINGIGTYGGLRTAYDAGTGTIKECRGQGLTTRMLQESMPLLRQEGIKQYVLEVLQHNDAAVGIYKKAGFTVARELDYFVANMSEVANRALPQQFSIEEIDLRQLESASDFHDFQPSWQNTYDAVMREPSYFKFIGAYSGRELVGFGLIEPDTGDIPQIAVRKEHRRQGVGSAILQRLLQHNKHSTVKVINTDSTYEPISAFLKHNGIHPRGKQFEMVLPL